jgi:hypothetical protein
LACPEVGEDWLAGLSGGVRVVELWRGREESSSDDAQPASAMQAAARIAAIRDAFFFMVMSQVAPNGANGLFINAAQFFRFCESNVTFFFE